MRSRIIGHPARSLWDSVQVNPTLYKDDGLDTVQSINARSKCGVTTSLADAESNKVRHVLTGPTLLAEKPSGRTLSLGKYRQQDVRAGRGMTTQPMHRELRTLHALPPQ